MWSFVGNGVSVRSVSNIVVRRDTFFDLEDDFRGFASALRFEIITFGLGGFIHNNLFEVSLIHTLKLPQTLKLVGCLRVTLQPITLLKCTVVVFPCPSNIVFPACAGMMCRYSPSIASTRSFNPTKRIGCFRQTVYFL